MKDNIFKTELLDLASKLDAVTNSCGELIMAANAVVEEQDHASTIYLVRKTSKLKDTDGVQKEVKVLAVALKDSLMKFYGYLHIMEANDQFKFQRDDDTRTLSELLDDLNKLIGLEVVKSKVNDLIAYCAAFRLPMIPVLLPLCGPSVWRSVFLINRGGGSNEPPPRCWVRLVELLPLFSRGPEQEGHDLRAGARRIGAECRCAGAGGDAVFRSP